MSRPVISTPQKKHSTFTNPSFLEAQLSFIGHSLKRNTHKQPFLFKTLESVLIATTCVITQATKQMWGNDFSVQITAETWREIWQNALRMCSSSSTEENSALTTNVSQLKTWENVPSRPTMEDDRRHLQPQHVARPQNSTLPVKYSAGAAEYFWCWVWCEPSVLRFPCGKGS